MQSEISNAVFPVIFTYILAQYIVRRDNIEATSQRPATCAMELDPNELIRQAPRRLWLASSRHLVLIARRKWLGRL